MKGDSYKIRYNDYGPDWDEWVNTTNLRTSKEKKAEAKENASLVNSRWQQVSVTSANGETKTNGSYVGLSIYGKGNTWDITTTISYGSGVQILARGTFKLNGNRLTLYRQDGTVHGDFFASIDRSNQLVLTRTNGKGTEVYTFNNKL